MGGAVDNTSAATFIPELWSDEIVAAYKRTLVLGNLVSKMPMSGKKGDLIHVPKPTRGSASVKSAGTAVTIQADVETEVQIEINRHFEYSRFIEDITETQALSSLRQFYTNDAGYALGKQVDDDLHYLGTGLGDSAGFVNPEVATSADWVNTGVFYADASSGLTEYAVAAPTAADVFTDEIFRDLIQKLDDADVPMDGRSFVVPPSMRNAIMGIDRYVSSDFVNGKSVNTGKIGELYGIDVYVSSNCPVVEAGFRAATLLHKDTYVFAEQMAVRSQTQYKQEFLSNLYTGDTIYGKQVMRPDAGFVLVVAD
jgi:HK97 family phage major capsid protein